jgi:hypothetical protein
MIHADSGRKYLGNNVVTCPEQRQDGHDDARRSSSTSVPSVPTVSKSLPAFHEVILSQLVHVLRARPYLPRQMTSSLQDSLKSRPQ